MEFANLAHTFEELERTSSRLTLIELLTQLFRSIARMTSVRAESPAVGSRVGTAAVSMDSPSPSPAGAPADVAPGFGLIALSKAYSHSALVSNLTITPKWIVATRASSAVH